MSRTPLVLILLLAPALSGCLDWLPDEVRDPLNQLVDQLGPQRGTVFASELLENDWNHNAQFMARVVYEEPLTISAALEDLDTGDIFEVVKRADEASYDEALAQYTNEVDFPIPDGEWKLKLVVDGKVRKEWNPLRVDGTPPSVSGLESVGKASEGTYVIGDGATWDSDATVAVMDSYDMQIASDLPVAVSGLGDGFHPYTVIFTDPAGNELLRTVQVLAGNAKELPAGQHTAGIVARYSNEVEIWDISNPSAYLSRPAAAASQPGYLGSGFGITPNDPEVQAVVDEVVTPDMNSMDAALALFRWLYDELEYTDERLQEDDLLDPQATFANGGGVCRDLAAAYVSLLRAADVPARLVTGYLAGQVNGFHAWVEFYAGPVDGHDGWVPVDVSPIDGVWTDDDNFDGHDDGLGVMMQSFGVRLPHYLPLRALPGSAEVEGWATAIAVSYEFPQGSPPEFEYEKTLTVEGEVEGVLCIHSETWVRMASQNSGSCDSGTYDAAYGTGSTPFIIQSTQVIDYGIAVSSAVDGTKIRLQVAVPYPEEVGPVSVERLPYVSHDDPNGKVPQFGDRNEGKRLVTLTF